LSVKIIPESRGDTAWEFMDVGFSAKNILGCLVDIESGWDLGLGHYTDWYGQFVLPSGEHAVVFYNRRVSTSIILIYKVNKGGVRIESKINSSTEHGDLDAWFLRHVPVLDASRQEHPTEDDYNEFLVLKAAERCKYRGAFRLLGNVSFTYENDLLSRADMSLRSSESIPRFDEWLESERKAATRDEKYWSDKKGEGANATRESIRKWKSFVEGCSKLPPARQAEIEGSITGAWMRKKPILDFRWP
jgi:hypothetical protein